MKVEVVKVERVYNLGDYESIRIGYEAVLSDVEAGDDANILNITKQLEGLADQYYQHGRFKRNGTGKPQPQTQLEKPQPKTPERDPVLLARFPPELQEHIKKASAREILVEYISAGKFAPIAAKIGELGYTRKPAKSGSRWVKA